VITLCVADKYHQLVKFQGKAQKNNCSVVNCYLNPAFERWVSLSIGENRAQGW
jgi:hypothetical protein